MSFLLKNDRRDFLLPFGCPVNFHHVRNTKNENLFLRFRLNAGYDVARISQKLDFINIMTYDLRGPWDGKADHHAPIEARPTDSWAFRALNTKNGIEKWIEKGAPREKLIMGIPFYGRTFTLSNPNSNKPGSTVSGGGGRRGSNRNRVE